MTSPTFPPHAINPFPDYVGAGLDMPRRDNTAYLAAIQQFRWAWAAAERQLGGPVVVAQQAVDQHVDSYVITFQFKRAAE